MAPEAWVRFPVAAIIFVLFPITNNKFGFLPFFCSSRLSMVVSFVSCFHILVNIYFLFILFLIFCDWLFGQGSRELFFK